MKRKFADVTEEQIKQKIKDKKPTNTTKSEENWVKIWNEWAEQQELQPLQQLSKAEVAEAMRKFIPSVRKQNGERFMVTSLKTIVRSILRWRGEQEGQAWRLDHDAELFPAKQVLEAEMWLELLRENKCLTTRAGKRSISGGRGHYLQADYQVKKNTPPC